VYIWFRLLASGSDDVQVIIWDPFHHKSLTTVRTEHEGNIFSVKVNLNKTFKLSRTFFFSPICIIFYCSFPKWYKNFKRMNVTI